MKKIALLVMLFAAFAVSAGSAAAQQWPLSNTPYLCRWQTPSNPNGKALVTITFTSTSPDGITKYGTIKTVYPPGSSVDKAIQVTWDFWSGETRFLYSQPNEGINCTLTTSGYGSGLAWTYCSNGNSQQCFQ